MVKVCVVSKSSKVDGHHAQVMFVLLRARFVRGWVRKLTALAIGNGWIVRGELVLANQVQ